MNVFHAKLIGLNLTYWRNGEYLGLGAGVVKGAYARLPRYFADADRVMDLESRILWCMVALQGFSDADSRKQLFGNGNERKSDMEAIVAYVTSESRGVAMNVGLAHPKEAEMYRLGERIFHFRGGPGSTRLWRFCGVLQREDSLRDPCLDRLDRSASAA